MPMSVNLYLKEKHLPLLGGGGHRGTLSELHLSLAKRSLQNPLSHSHPTVLILISSPVILPHKVGYE